MLQGSVPLWPGARADELANAEVAVALSAASTRLCMVFGGAVTEDLPRRQRADGPVQGQGRTLRGKLRRAVTARRRRDRLRNGTRQMGHCLACTHWRRAVNAIQSA